MRTPRTFSYIFLKILISLKTEDVCEVVGESGFCIVTTVIMSITNLKKNDAPNFEQLFHRDMLIFRIMGLSEMHGIFTEQKLIAKWWNGIPINIGVVALIMQLICEFQTMCQVFHEHLNYAILLFSAVCSGASSATKAIRLWTFYSELYGLLQELRIMWEFARCENFLTKKITEAAEHTRKFTKYYTILITVLITSYMIRPYTLVLDYHFQTDTNDSFDFSQIMVPCKFPFVINSFTKFFICVTFQQFVGMIACLVWVSCDTLFAQLTTHVSLQFLILANELNKTIDNRVNLMSDRQVSQKMRNIINKYQKLFICCESIETFFNPIIFFTVLSNAMNLCCCIYRLDEVIAASNWNEVAKNMTLVITLSIQTLIFCSFANTLTENSTQICETIYNSQWVDCNQKLKMTLLIIMIRARKEFSCKAYGIITLNYKQLTNIANAAVSYFMLLRNFS